MIIDSSVIGSAAWPNERFRVIVHEEESISDPRDWWPLASDIDVAMWRDDLWSYVWVQVIKLHTCPDCMSEHETDRSESLGMVAYGHGDGWKVGMTEIIEEHPAPDLIEEIMSGTA